MSTKPKQFEIWIADLNTGQGTKKSKERPVLVIQTNQLNKVHPATLICPITSHVQHESQVLRVQIKKGIANVLVDCDVMIDQIRAIDNRKLTSKVGNLPRELAERVKRNIKIVLDLD
jgi:mRNA interferase MazF